MNIWDFIEKLPKNFDATKEVKVCDWKGYTASVSTIELDTDGNLLIHFDMTINPRHRGVET